MCYFEHDSIDGEHIYIYCHIHNWLEVIVPVMAITVVGLVVMAAWKRFRR